MTSRALHRSGAIPPIAVAGEGIYPHLADGTRIIDGSGAAAACLGQRNQRIASAIGRQAAAMAYAHTGALRGQPAEQLAHLVLDGEPGGLTHSYFCSSDSDGTEAALNLARQYYVEISQARRTRFIARRQSYHGNTLGALGADGNMKRRASYEPILAPAFSRLSPCFAYRFQRADETDQQHLDRLADELRLNERVKSEALARGLAIHPIGGTTDGTLGDHVMVAPPYIARASDIDTIVDRVGGAVDAPVADALG